KHEIFAWDQASYADASVSLWYTLTHHARVWPTEMFKVILGARPPAVAWLGQFFVPIGQAMHSVDFGLLLSVVLTCFGTL
ncbi:hypothetical protein ABTA44_20905, partial [Acinetobacter baumannii]